MKKVLIYRIDSQLTCHVEEPDSHLPMFNDAHPIAAFDVSDVFLHIN